jgi:hypothetical protein
MRLQQALGSAPVQSLIDAIAREQVEVALGRGIQESAATLPPRPHDGTLVDALLSEPVLSSVRARAAEKAAAAVARAKAAPSVAASREKHLQRVRLRMNGGRTMPQNRHPALDRRDELVRSASAPDRRTTGGRILETMLEPVARDDDDLVLDVHSGRIVEAAVAATPPAQRGWRERMAVLGCGQTTIAALGGSHGEAAGARRGWREASDAMAEREAAEREASEASDGGTR